LFYLKLILVLFAAVTAESLLPRLWDGFRYVDLPLIVTVYFALMRDPVLGMLTGYAAGLSGDLAPGSGPIIGVGGFSKTIIGFLVATVAVRFSLEGPLVRVLVIGLSSVVNSVLFIALHNLMDTRLTDETSPEWIAMRVAFEAAGNLIVGVVLFWLMDKLFPEHAASGQMRVRRRFYD
jgi:rod shape-determining protein MreD